MRLVGMVLLAIAALVIGSSLSAVWRAPWHLRMLLADQGELQRIVKFLGAAKLAQEASSIKPVFGSYAHNIITFEQIHLRAFGRTRNLLIAGAVVVLVCAAYVGTTFGLVTAAILALPMVLPLASSAKNENAALIHSVSLNLLKWESEDPAGCASFCSQQRPDLQTLHQTLSSIP